MHRGKNTPPWGTRGVIRWHWDSGECQAGLTLAPDERVILVRVHIVETSFAAWWWWPSGCQDPFPISNKSCNFSEGVDGANVLKCDFFDADRVWQTCGNDTNQVSGWWDMREWWWKIGFKPQENRHFCPGCQHLSPSAISSYLWVLSLIVASWGAHTQFTFQKYPFFRPLSTPFAYIYIYLYL